MISEHIPYLLEAQMQCYNSYIALMEHIFETERLGDKDKLTASDFDQRRCAEEALKHYHNVCLQKFVHLKCKTMKMTDIMESATLKHIQQTIFPPIRKTDTPLVPPDLLGPRLKTPGLG